MDAAASPPPSPSVVAVLVTDGRGPHLEEVLRALVAQDHPHLEVLVVAHGDGDPTARVHAVAPAARVHRAAGAAGRAEAANAVIGRVTGAEFYLFLHDDAAPDPGAVAALVAAADRSGADVVGPKLVRWDDHRRITQLGMGVDRVATILPYVEWGELDQGQHDGVREVFAVPGAFVLVRARRFEEVGGFDEAIHAERAGDLSLAWRARIAGATVVVTSAARVRHAEACTPGPAGARAARDRVRVLLTSDRWG
ncbi:MAG TPA: glycosyltransferase, partial [Acidimicrobiales bacterium]|nr:glycosyltransferase [Acidimicrobiales bacterium]